MQVLKDLWKNHKKAILICAGLLVALLIFLYLADTISTSWNKSRIEKGLQDVKQREQEAANILTNIHSTDLEKIEAKANINAAKANLNTIREEVNNAQVIANQALENVNALNSLNFNNTSPDNANAARCRAFPDSAECK